jgi:hypothetical protein
MLLHLLRRAAWLLALAALDRVALPAPKEASAWAQLLLLAVPAVGSSSRCAERNKK